MDNKLKYITAKLSDQVPAFPEVKKYRDWVRWGADNNFPSKIIELNSNSTVNKSILNNKLTFVMGSGLDKSIYYGQPNLNSTWDEFLDNIFNDYIQFGCYSFQIILNEDTETFSYFHQDVSQLRVGHFDDYSRPLTYYISEDWNKTSGRLTPQPIKAWGTESPQPGEVYMFYYKDYIAGMKFYGLPSYYQAINYIEAEALLGSFHKNAIQNGFAPSTIITFSNNPNEEEQAQIQSDIEANFTGTNGANTVMCLFGTSKDEAPIVEKFDASTNGDLFNALNDITFQKIITAHNLTSPTLAGLSGSGNLSGNANEIINAFIVYNDSVITKIRNKVLNVMNTFLIMNGYKEPFKIIELDIINNIKESQVASTEQSNKEKQENA